MPVYDEEAPDFIEMPLISGDFLNSVPGAMEMFVPELAAELEEKIKADQESDHPSPDKCINISITTDQLVRLVKRRVSIHVTRPYSKERRQRQSQWAKENGLKGNTSAK